MFTGVLEEHAACTFNGFLKMLNVCFSKMLVIIDKTALSQIILQHVFCCMNTELLLCFFMLVCLDTIVHQYLQYTLSLNFGWFYRNCQLLSMTLNEVGFENVALHAMIRQKERLAALAKFRSNIIRILIATDVASRGGYHHFLFVFIVCKKLNC